MDTYNLVNFPDYRMDTETGRLYSYTTGMEREVKGYLRSGKGRQRKYCIKSSCGIFRIVGIGRLMASALWQCDYDRLPKDLCFNWTPEEGLTMRSKKEAANLGWERREREKAAVNRIEMLDKTIREIGLIRQAYLGDLYPLSTYLHSQRQHYIDKVRCSRLSEGGGGEEGIAELVDRCIFLILDNITKGTMHIILLESWIYKTVIGMIKNIKARRQVPLTNG